MSLEAGTRLGSYEIVESIGVGAMGEVYRAKDLKLGREIALKVLPTQFAADRERLRRFEQEARAASALNHPNIVHIYDIGREGETHYIAMELVAGVNLRTLLAEAPFTNDRILDLGRQLAAGLANAHAAGIVHRDVKPENVMVTDDGFVKILDFGLAKLVEVPFETHSEMATMARLGTRHGMLIGTVEYMSPEQAAGKAVDRRSDQFSLGLILYEMATGKLAFRRETAAQTLASIIESEPRPMGELNRRCPSELVRIVRRCLEKDPDARYDDTKELVKELRSVSTDEHVLPPLPPVPQNPEPDAPAFGRGVIAIGTDIDDALGGGDGGLEILFGRGKMFQIQSDGGKTRTMSDKRLRRRLRSGRYSGTELVRQTGEVEWKPLYESEMFRQEVPHEGNPRDVARKRKVMEFAQHLCTYVTFGAAWFFFKGEIPFWMGFWGIGLAAHAVGTLPAALPLLRRRRELAAPARETLDVEAKVLPEGLLSTSFSDEVARVKELLNKRGGKDSGSLVQEIDGIVTRMVDLATKQQDLAEQTSSEERAKLAEAIGEVERKLAEANTAGDRRLYQRQHDVLRHRQEAIDKAVAVIDRLIVRQNVAENQIKQLRLDLSRAEASSASVPELTSRLQDIRHEVDATEQVDEAIAQELLS